jgi:hypothetical protein
VRIVAIAEKYGNIRLRMRESATQKSVFIVRAVQKHRRRSWNRRVSRPSMSASDLGIMIRVPEWSSGRASVRLFGRALKIASYNII